MPTTGTSTEHIVEILGRVPLFQGLPRPDLERIAALVLPREAAEGEFLFREGDPGEQFYIVYSGAVEVLKERPLGDHERLAIKRGGEAFGEMSLLNDAPRSASVRAIETTRLLTVPRAKFDELLGGEDLGVRLLRGLARALRSLDVRFAARDSGSGAEPLRRFGQLVLRGLEPRSTPRIEGLQVAGGTTRDDGAVAGSLWDAVPAGAGATILALMDVKGSGFPPAYLIAITRALLHEVGPGTPFPELLRRLNAATFRNMFEGMDECVETALLEIRDGTLRWSCAGTQPAVVVRGDGSTEDLAPHGPPLGILPHFDYGVTDVALGPGDTILAFSEAPAGLVTGAIELVQARPEADAAQLVRLLTAAINQVHAPQSGTDLAFMVVRRG